MLSDRERELIREMATSTADMIAKLIEDVMGEVDTTAAANGNQWLLGFYAGLERGKNIASDAAKVEVTA